MTFFRSLWRAELVAILCLIAYAVMFSVVMNHDARPEAWLEQTKLLIYLVVAFGAPPVLIVFAPIYAALRAKGVASFGLAALAGALASLVVAVIDRIAFLGTITIASGAAVALGTHWLMAKWK